VTIRRASFTALTFRAADDGATSFMGIAECRRAAQDNIPVTVRFESRVDLASEQFFGGRLLENVYTFGVDRGTTAGVDCSVAGSCATLSSSSVMFSGLNIDATVRFRDLTGIQGPADCETGELDREYFIRIAFRTNPNSNVVDTEDMRLIVDTVRPAPPAGFSAQATEQRIRFEWDASPTGDVNSYSVFYSEREFEGGVLPANLPSGVIRAGSTVMAGGVQRGSVPATLTSGDTIYVAVSARDLALNDSVVIGPTPVEVIATTDFWSSYRAGGGEELGGYCAAVPASGGAPVRIVWMVTGLVCVGAMVRRRRR
jgi:hypothetical protein